MLKVTIVDTRSQRRIILEGALVPPWVEELKKWSATADKSSARQLIIDLDNVTTISKEAEGVLSDLVRQGARFLCAGVYTKYQLKQITRKFQAKLGGAKNQGSSND